MDHGHKEWMWTSPDCVPIVTIPSEERGTAHRRDTGEMGVGRDGRVIDLHVLTGREGGRRRGWERTQACLQPACSQLGSREDAEITNFGLLLVSSNKL
jgi:hypothetical protein